MNACGIVPRSYVLVGLLLVLADSALSCLGCRVTRGYPPPPFPNEELLLDGSAFPEGWSAYEGFSNPREWLPADQIGRHYVRHDCPRYSLLASHSVYRFFEGENSAIGGYQRCANSWFAPEEDWEAWAVPAELPYHSPVADEYRFNCHGPEGENAWVCQAVGRYNEYVVRLLVDMDSEPEYPECMSFADLERILVAIDERMAQYLSEGDGAPMD